MDFLLSIFLDQERRPRTVWRFIIYGVGFIAINFVVQLAVLVALVVYYLAFLREGRPGGVDEIGKWVIALTEEDKAWVLMSIVTPPATLTLFAFTCLCRKFLDWRSIRSMGYVRPENRPTSAVWAGFAWGVLPILGSAGVLLLLRYYEYQGLSLSVQALILLPTLVLAAWMEEFVFRGYLLQNLLDIRRPVFAVLFSSIVFWLVHAFNPSAWSSPLIVINLFGAGVLCALAYMVSGNIWFPTVMHFSWNMAQGVLLSIPISGIQVEGFINLKPVEPPHAPAGSFDWLAGTTLPNVLTGGAFGLEASILVTLGEVLMIGVFLAVLKSRSAAAGSTPIEAELLTANSPRADSANPYQSPQQL